MKKLGPVLGNLYGWPKQSFDYVIIMELMAINTYSRGVFGVPLFGVEIKVPLYYIQYIILFMPELAERIVREDT